MANKEVANGESSIYLTPEQRHSLLKSLVCAQMLDEWAILDETNALEQYGPPFVNNGASVPPMVGRQTKQNPEHAHSPLILRHLFHVHLRRFPGLKTAKVDYWRKQIIPFFVKLSEATFSNSQERSELTNRKLLAFVATRYLATFWSRGIGLRGDKELKGPGRGAPGSEKWGVGKQWGRGTVKRGLERPVRPSEKDRNAVNSLFNTSSDDELVWLTAGQNVLRLKRDWSSWKEEIIESEGGLKLTLEQLEVKSLNNLPAKYRNATEWVRRHVAFVLWTIFVQHPGGDEILSIIKIIHTLFPYWGAKQLLKIANAKNLIKAIIDLVLARPIGMIDSLGQRIFFAVMNSEMSSINRNFLSPLRKAIDDDELCKALDGYVKMRTCEQRDRLMRHAREQNQDTLISILQEGNYSKMDRLEKGQHDFLVSPLRSHLDWAYFPYAIAAKKMRTRPPTNILEQISAEGLLFARCKLYLRERLRRRDREKVLEIGSGALVPGIIKESLEVVFYSIIYEIALVSDLSARLGDLQRFVDDLIRVKSRKLDDLEDWIALCARHENSLYIFVHEIRSAVAPVFDWCQEALDFMALSTTDPGNPSNRKAPNIEINLEDMLVQAGKDSSVDIDAIMQELKEIEAFSRWYKIEQEVQMRKEYVNIRDDSISNVTILPRVKKGGGPVISPSNAMAREVTDVPHLVKNLMKLHGVECDDGKVQNGSRGTDIGDLPWGYFGTDDLLHQHYAIIDDNAMPLEYSIEQRVSPPPPTLSHIRTLLPAFRERLRRILPDWPSKAKC